MAEAKTDANGNELMAIEEIAVSDGGAARFAAVEVTNGEERYNVMWESPAKLLRFDEGENAWKERGQGTAKILQSKEDSGRYTFIFRREAIGKLAAHHRLFKDMKARVHPQSDKAITWMAFKDYTDDDEGFPESFVMRFPSKEAALAALKEMEKAMAASSL